MSISPSEKKLVLDIENDINTKSKLSDLYGPKDTFLFMFIGIMSFLILFLVFQYFATFNEGIGNNFKYIFCNKNSDEDNAGSTSDVGVSDSVNFNNN